MTSSKFDRYAVLDRPEVLSSIFHPRAQWSKLSDEQTQTRPLIKVAPDVHIGSAFHMADVACANILFFHGNGEIVADYDDLAPLFNQIGLNFIVVDYRGYGLSTGRPTVSAMMEDSHKILDFVVDWLKHNQYSGPLIVMGRSLGSASALELAAARQELIDGLIIESGFAFAAPLLRLLGVDVGGIGFNEDEGFGNRDKIGKYKGPTLIIHAEYDHIISFADGQALFEAAADPKKRFLKIDGANHNDIFYRGMNEYMAAVKALAEGL